ncbi:hypothetical protein YQE_06295, partial [Dendroctonus ponderosae]
IVSSSHSHERNRTFRLGLSKQTARHVHSSGPNPQLPITSRLCRLFATKTVPKIGSSLNMLDELMAANPDTEPYKTVFGPVVDNLIVPNDPRKSMMQYTDIFKRSVSVKKGINVKVKKPRFILPVLLLFVFGLGFVISLQSATLEELYKELDWLRFELMYGVTQMESIHLPLGGDVALIHGMLEHERDDELRKYMRMRCEMKPEACFAQTSATYNYHERMRPNHLASRKLLFTLNEP